MKKSAIIYGLGNRFNNDYFQKFILLEIKKVYDVQGVSDRKKPDYLRDSDFAFVERSDKLAGYDKIIVTSGKYYDEIREELIQQFNLSGNCIISLDEIEKEILNKKLHMELFRGGCGVEVGGPSHVFRHIYSLARKCDDVNFNANTVWWKDSGKGYCFKGKKMGEVIIADAVDLSKIEDNNYDFYISSNNLEHIANPLRALSEAKRIVKNNGLMLVVVPRKEACFDHRRSVTTLEHLCNDFDNCIDEHDLSHLDEILELHDFEMDDGVASVEEFELRSMNNYDNRCLHHHVFDEHLLRQVFEYMNIDIIDSGDLFDNYFILGTIQKESGL